MKGFFTSSIGKKVIMSVSGLFLVLFLLVHLVVNMVAVFDSEAFNAVAHFMGTNPAIYIMQYALAAGFLFHMLYATILTLKNRAARPVKYAVATQSDVSWSSRNMFITGFAILTFLVIHLINYFYKIKFTDLIDSGKMTEFELVQGIFQPEYWYYSVLYIISFVFLALHLNHSFQSAWHTLGLSNSKWLPRLKVIGTLYTLLVAVGFTIIPIYFFLKAVL